MSEPEALVGDHIPTVYFIDDSATMREVIKIAFRHESINVITCHDAASALSQFEAATPDVVITDVIMPDKDGYEVCQTIKQNPELRKIPVILMSGVVNRSVAEKAIAAQADELIRKPFQPQDLIARVKNLLSPAVDSPLPPESSSREISPSTPAVLSNIFAPPPASSIAMSPRDVSASHQNPHSRPSVVAPVIQSGNEKGSSSAHVSAELQKLKHEVRRLEMLVRKLQSDLQAERQYVASLEEHLKTLQEAE